ncbi:MAG: hypothetical protein AAFW00_21550 [Bacteroidota bacterium]
MEILAILERPKVMDGLGYHIIMSVWAFVGTYALLFFGPILLLDDIELSAYFLDHPPLKFGLCLAVVVLFNLFIVIRNSRKQHIIGLVYREETKDLLFELINLYSRSSRQVIFPLSEVSWERKKVSIYGLESKKILIFKHKSEKVFARIDPSLNPWEQRKKDIREGMKKLIQIKET